MNDIVKKALNRGAPIDTPVLIDIEEFLDLFESEDVIEQYRNSVRGIVSGISNLCQMYCGDFALPTLVTIRSDENNNKKLCFSAENFLYTLLLIAEGVIPDEEILNTLDSKEKIALLKNRLLSIKSEDELRSVAPGIYKLYKTQVIVNDRYLELERITKDKSLPLEYKMEVLSKNENRIKEFYSEFDLRFEQQFAHDFSLDVFLSRIADVIETLIINIEYIVGLYIGNSFELNEFNEEDADKLNLYLASKFMDKIEEVEASEKQRYLFYLSNYFKENVENEVKRVKLKINGHKVTPINLYERYKNLLVANPDLVTVNFSNDEFKDMSKSEIEEFIVAYLSELKANWELIPANDTSVEKTIKAIASNPPKKLTTEELKARQQKLVNLYIAKKRFYDGTDPYFRIKGKNTFDGYVGFIYANSLVVLEKFYERVEDKKVAKNEAIYIMSMKEFYELSQHSKMYLITNHLCKRVIHSDGWQERVLKYINKKELKESPQKTTEQLIAEKKVTISSPTLH